MKTRRNKAWRVAKRKAKKSHIEQAPNRKRKGENCWKLMYIRSEKLHRSKQLGVEYPTKTLRQVLDDELPLED